jgi:small subunit ribosomal protein S1
MVMENIYEETGLTETELQDAVKQAMGDYAERDMRPVYEESIKNFETGSILTGRVVNILNDDVIVDVGYKSEGIIPKEEFDEPSALDVDDEIEVLLEAVEDDSGLIVLSKRKADRIRGWEKLVATHKEGDIVRGRVMRKIKGGLLVDVGVPVFLPASQVTLRRAGDISEFIGREIEAKILKIDESRRNIVVSRRKLLEEERSKKKDTLMAEIEVGQTRKGIVKNIPDFGAFVDLGGIDGLLHITDMSWGRISHPSEMVAIDQEIEVKILNIDREKDRIALGLKQKSPSPWVDVDKKYPVGSVVKGQVVNLLPYGAFVKLEEGIEGLVHVSEMSWTRRVNHPSEIVAIGDVVEVVVLDINKQKEEISLGMKQTEVNPWTLVEQKYPPGTRVTGRVRNMTSYGAFIEIEEGIDGLLHVSDMSWTKRVNSPSEVLKKGDTVETIVISVDQEKKRVALGMKQLEGDPWEDEIPTKYHQGMSIHGTVTKLANFGAFVEIEDGLEGLLHISEMSDSKIGSPEEVVKVGEKVDVVILRVECDNRRIGLSLKRADSATKADDDEAKTEGEEAAAGGDETKAEGGEAPADDAETKAEGGETPADDAETKAEGDEAPADDAEDEKKEGGEGTS